MVKDYGQRRDFAHTPEPLLGVAKAGEGPLAFVVQKHAARQLHYDFRLELDGILKSWSVPGGPSLNPAVKRLAVNVDDHPIAYLDFEGVIPKGQYGAGQVIVWDHGTYSPEDGKFFFGDREEGQQVARDGLANGKLSITLRGHKLKGSWTLVKMKKTENNWLLIKHDDFNASTKDVLKEGQSVISKLSIDDLRAGQTPAGSASEIILASLQGTRRSRMPSKIAPMLAEQISDPFLRTGWYFEPKLDGFRTLVSIRDGTLQLISRDGLDVTRRYSFLIGDLKKQPASELILDGEIVALDEKGRVCFQCLQEYAKSLRLPLQAKATLPIIYYVFDILYLDGYDLRNVTLRRRKEWLDSVLTRTESIRLVDYFEDNGEIVYKPALKAGLEGVMAKSADSAYESGKRSSAWLKVKKILSDDFIIGGYTQGNGNRSRTFGALLLGQYDEKGRLVFAGHVGTGFDEPTLVDLRRQLDKLEIKRCLFEGEPPRNAPTTWVRPELVAEMKFAERTQEGYLRTPVFLRLRDDKPPSEVRIAEMKIATASTPSSPAVRPDPPKDLNEGILERLQNPEDSFFIEVEENRIKLNNLSKELWPSNEGRPALTKRDFIIYMAKVAPYLLTHLRDRPLTLFRFPDGINGERFYQKHWHNHIPAFVERVILQERAEGPHEYLLCNNLATLMWLGQLADLEIHTWFSRISPVPDRRDLQKSNYSRTELVNRLVDYPDFIIFDIDPYIYSGREPRGAEPELNRIAFNRACEAALWLKEALDKVSLLSFVKTSGKTGLHVFVPVLRQFDYLTVRSAAETVSRFIRQGHIKVIALDWAVEKRRGKVFLDYNQNVLGKTLASVYSPRVTPEATVSTPLTWDEVGKIYPTDFTILTVAERVAERGDIWAKILNAKGNLKALLRNAGERK